MLRIANRMGCKCESDGHTESNWKAKTHSAKVVCMANRIDAERRKCCRERDETRSKSTLCVNFREIPRYGRNCRKGLQENGVRRLYRETRRKTPRRKERRRDRRKKERRQESEGKTETRKQDEITRRSGREGGIREFAGTFRLGVSIWRKGRGRFEQDGPFQERARMFRRFRRRGKHQNHGVKLTQVIRLTQTSRAGAR